MSDTHKVYVEPIHKIYVGPYIVIKDNTFDKEGWSDFLLTVQGWDTDFPPSIPKDLSVFDGKMIFDEYSEAVVTNISPLIIMREQTLFLKQIDSLLEYCDNHNIETQYGWGIIPHKV